MKSINAMGVYEVAALLISVFWLVGCGGSMQGRVSSSNPPTTSSGASSIRAISKFLYVVTSIEETVQALAIDSPTGSLTATGAAVATDDVPIYAAATPDGNFLYVANAVGVSVYRIDGLRGTLTPAAPAEFAATGGAAAIGGSGGLTPAAGALRGCRDTSR